ncbi:MAG: class I SAM-dependent methyltransferase [Burkholderiales bacterium]|nr:class I SAM-dependent methyltransferase [Burkholderiales bacterium]
MITSVNRFILLFAWTAAAAAIAQTPPPATPEYGDEFYRPHSGQAGKNVVWVPTPDELVQKMLRSAKVTEKDVVYDLGAGDGKIPIAAARDFKARAIGIEYNPEMAELARRNAKRAGVDDRVKIITGDIFESDFSEATVVTLYLLPDLNYKLRPTILKMKPGTRVVSHQFNMRDWEADETYTEGYRDAYLWIVPAQAAGRWTFKEEKGEWLGTADLSQVFQRVGGYLTVGNKSQPLLAPTLTGDQLAFSFVDPDGQARSIRGKINGDNFEGWLRLSTYDTKVTGTRTALPK